VIVIDYFHWTAQGDWQFDPRDWPDPDAMVEELDEMGVRVMVSIWPSVTTYSKNFNEMTQRGLLVRADSGTPALKLLSEPNFSDLCYIHFYDPTNPEARKFVWDQVREGYFKHGIKVYWLDACEPAVHPVLPENQRYFLGSGRSFANLYPLLNAQTFFDGLQEAGEKDIITLSRSAWAGIQRFGAAVWSGDISSTFEVLQAQVRGGLNIALSGVPWWTTDIGGFFTPNNNTEYFRELLIRWFQYGVFCPLFRLHGWRSNDEDCWDTGGPNEVWSYGEAAYNIICELLFLREGLRPYIQEQMRLAKETGLPPMRPLFVDYHQDEQTWAVEDQFLFGPDLLVAPVLHQGATSRSVYLPSGQVWVDAWSGEELAGGQWLSSQAPLERIPVYQRKGSTLPLLSRLIDLAKAKYHHTHHTANN
jgi:alpha-D-xyloside xylohydrolase